MGWATVADVRSLVYTAEPDSQVEASLTSAQEQIEDIAGTVYGEVPRTLSLAHTYLAAVLLLRFMQSNGEMAYFNKIGTNQTYNQIEPLIKHYQSVYDRAMSRYASNNVSGSIYQLVKPVEGL